LQSFSEATFFIFFNAAGHVSYGLANLIQQLTKVVNDIFTLTRNNLQISSKNLQV